MRNGTVTASGLTCLSRKIKTPKSNQTPFPTILFSTLLSLSLSFSLFPYFTLPPSFHRRPEGKMKVRSKGKVHPSPTSSSHSPENDIFSVLKLLPAAFLALVTVLSLEDREVLAYMITRSLKSTNPPSLIHENTKSKKKSPHKPPAFDCECFDCYTSYWFKWDSSSNRELIHQAIEAFEEHLNHGEQSKRKGKKRDKLGRRHFAEKPVQSSPPEKESADLSEIEEGFVQVYLENVPPEAEVTAAEAEGGIAEEVAPEVEVEVVVKDAAAISHKGLARKVLPDVLGLLNSRLWNLWSPNV